MVDWDPEVVEDRGPEPLRVIAFEGGVNSRLTAASHIHIQVARKRKHRHLLGAGIDPPHHDRVGTLPKTAAVPKPAGKRRVGIQASVVVGAGDQKIAGIRLGCGETFLSEVGNNRHRCSTRGGGPGGTYRRWRLR